MKGLGLMQGVGFGVYTGDEFHKGLRASVYLEFTFRMLG